MALNPMEQFAIKPLIAEPLAPAIAGHPIYFTNQALLMVIVAGASALFLTLAWRSQRPGALVEAAPSPSAVELSCEFVGNMIHTATGEDGLEILPLRLHAVHLRAIAAATFSA